jgi:DnaJ-class molecular chaperone
MSFYSDDDICTDCRGLGFTNTQGDGVCAECNGTGLEISILKAIEDILQGDEQTCKVCNGDGKCQTCGGTGRIS